MLGLTASFAIVEVVGGWLANSLALLADASHMVTDVAALTLALIGARLAQRREGSARRFGNLRWEILAALINGLALLVVSAMIVIEALGRMRAPEPVDSLLLGGVALVGLLVNLVALKVLHGHHHHDLNSRGAYLHVLGDLLGSVGAIVGAVLIHLTGRTIFDPLISMLVSVILVRSAWRLVRESATILLDHGPAAIPAERVLGRLQAVPGVTRVHDLHVWSVTSGLVAMSAHVVVPELAAHPVTLRALEAAMLAEGIDHVTIQLETDDDCRGVDCDDDVAERAGSPTECGHGHPAGHGHRH